MAMPRNRGKSSAARVSSLTVYGFRYAYMAWKGLKKVAK